MDEIKKVAYGADAPSLCEAFKNCFLLGSAIPTKFVEKGTIENEVVLKQYNVFTLENESKPVSVHPEEDRYDFSRVDKFVEFGEKNGVTLRGHTLVWHQACPDWFFYDKDGNLVSEDVLLARLKEHVTTIVSRYRGRIRTWDVVNEVIIDEGGMRESMWYKISGKNYIKQAFRWAREADPDARLLINEYNLESHDPKLDTMIDFVREMLEEGVPVDGIGLQMHLNLLNTDMDKLRSNVRKLAKLREIKPDLKFEVTELDLSCYKWEDMSEDVAWTDELHEQFRKKYTELFRFLIELSEEGILDTVLFWGINDGNSWLNGFPRRHKNYPMLIARDFILKDAYYDVLALAEKK